MGFSVWSKPTLRPVSPLGGNTINRRAVCGRPACTVRSGVGAKPIGPSYRIVLIESGGRDLGGVLAPGDVQGHAEAVTGLAGPLGRSGGGGGMRGGIPGRAAQKAMVAVPRPVFENCPGRRGRES